MLVGVPGVAGEPDPRGVRQELHRRRLGLGAGLSQEHQGERGLGEGLGVRVGGGREMAIHCIEEYLMLNS